MDRNVIFLPPPVDSSKFIVLGWIPEFQLGMWSEMEHHDEMEALLNSRIVIA